jgi:hypothetical protein
VAPWWAIALTGAGGGIINALLSEAHILWLPGFFKHEINGWGLRTGFLANAAIGIASGFLAYLLGDKITRPSKLGPP